MLIKHCLTQNYFQLKLFLIFDVILLLKTNQLFQQKNQKISRRTNLTMNFFDEQLMLDSPLRMNKKASNASSKFPPKDNPYIPSSIVPSKSKQIKDPFDDLLSNMAAQMNSKKNNSKSRQRQRQSSSRDISHSPVRERNKDFSKTVTGDDKWNTGGFFNQNVLATQVLPRNQQRGGLNSARSIQQDQYSDDGRSMQSGVTGKNSAAFQKASISGFDIGSGNRKQKFLQPEDSSMPPASSMRSMRGPLRKKDSREQSINEEVVVSTSFGNQIQIPSAQDFESHLPPKPPRRNQSQQSHKQIDDYPKANLFNHFGGPSNQTPLRNFDLSISGDKNANATLNSAKQKIIEKVIYVKEENKQVKEAHEKQLSMIKSSHERQLKFIQQNLEKQIAAHKQTRIQLMRQNQASLEGEKKKWKKIEQENVERIKSLNEWEQKKKDQTHKMQIERFKSLLDQATRFHNQHVSSQNQGLTKEEMKDKERQVERQRKRLIELQNNLKIRQKNVQLRQIEFQNSRKRQQDYIQHQKKKIYEAESQIKRQQIQLKRNMNFQRQSMASQLASAQLQVQKKRQSLRLQKEELNLEKEFFQRQKNQMQEFNKKILQGYKNKMKELEQEKQKVNNLEVQLYKKIHTVELMGTQTGANFKESFKTVNANANITVDRFQKQANFTKENYKNQSNQLEEKLKTTKQRFAKMQEWTRKNTGNNNSMTDRARATTNLDSYLLKINRGNQKIKKDYF